LAGGLLSIGQTLKDTIIIQQRSYYLNGGARAALGGKSRETIKIDLPKNTKRWYYSFTTSAGQDGTSLLNLGLQVAATLSTGGLGAAAASSIEVPPGSSTVDVVILPTEYRDAFVSKQDNYRFYPDVSVQNAKQAVQSIDNTYGNSFYVGLRNPSSMTAVNISIEVVAVVEVPNANREKAISFGNLAWAAYEEGDIEKCIILSKKALTLDNTLGYVKANLGLCYLIKNDETTATDYYIDALTDFKKEAVTKRRSIQAVIHDIDNAIKKYPTLQGASSIKTMFMADLR
jgi:tetratricopeptide (TPR) repeat protein